MRRRYLTRWVLAVVVAEELRVGGPAMFAQPGE